VIIEYSGAAEPPFRKGELKDLVKNSVEETLNALLDHEADELINA
jgi:hypothetical protein